ncbi:MAG TPA: hypothetical protein VFQ44_23585 [Streptosporangiaceae bacterium]|nr:hypothetical protein [Streptosporangiaceae bacterium]
MPVAVVAATALALVLGSCRSGPAADGPLGSGANGGIPRGANCVPRGHLQAFGDQQFTNHGDTAVVLDRVRLLHPDNERLIGSYAVPGDRLIGVVFWPPSYPDIPPGWKHRRPVHGFRLAPGRSFNMVLGVQAGPQGRGFSRGMLVYYHDSAGSYVARNDFAMIIAASTSHC